MVDNWQSLPRYGALTAAEIYSAVGQALSWWESSEDQLFGLFSSLNADNPSRIKSYGKATRTVRSQMLDKDLGANNALFRDGETAKLGAALEGLKALVKRRNEISHGYCHRQTATEEGRTTVDGHFLVPARTEAIPMERLFDMGNALTAVEINRFIEELRRHRSVVIDAQGAIMMRVQDLRANAEGRPITYGSGIDPWQPF